MGKDSADIRVCKRLLDIEFELVFLLKF